MSCTDRISPLTLDTVFVIGFRLLASVQETTIVMFTASVNKIVSITISFKLR